MKDASGASVNLMSGQTTVTAVAPLAVSSNKADKSSANIGDTITWTATASGGSGTLQYCFYIYKDGRIVWKGSYGTARTVSYKPAAAGSYTAKAFVKDASANSVSLMSAEIPVGTGEPLSVTGLRADKTGAALGETITWTVAASGGVGTLKYCYYVYENGAVVFKSGYGSAGTFSYAPAEAGACRVKVFVKDASGDIATFVGGQIAVS